ncbi:POU domain, class 6, transcription factor 2 isoform X3 [Aphidius gifuensis]|uniref:POU domain, class 6, transcription factor 2 isoform X3 n=1 Tax=Aphidius gifuensis TaxID=684658 RepID=UPI001CDC8555|nr:POU domain, class 6, transcription factor 2 isoform X3 [Aphidius gifuensis]
MAEGSAEEEQGNTAAPATPPSDLRSYSNHSSTSYCHFQDFQPQTHFYRQQSNMLATPVPIRHGRNNLLSDYIKTENTMDNTPYDFPLNLKNEGSDRSSTGSPEPTQEERHEHHMFMKGIEHVRRKRRSRSPESTTNAKLANETSTNGNPAGVVSLQNLQNLANLPKVAPLPDGLQSMSSDLSNNHLINTPLNLTVTTSATTLSSPSSTTSTPHPLPSSSAPVASLGQLESQLQPVALPQFILTSGQLIQGIQGAQILIPTSQGIATQTILTIPVNHVTNNQLVNLALSNGQVVSTTLANLQAIAHPQPFMNLPSGNAVPTGQSGGQELSLNSVALSHLLGNNPASHQLLNSMQQGQHLQSKASRAHMAPACPVSQPPQLATSPQHGQQHNRHTLLNHYKTPDEQERMEPSPPSNSPPMFATSTLNRLVANNGELTITTTHGPVSVGIKSSPGSQHSAKDDDEDLLSNSSRQPTINEATKNLVDGINLDQIKEFAKAFKLRRLSLGLTQTQVGQALSVTEGPAYSQSAICRFEKLDITPKSAQKIKPVLAGWMKEAEESMYDCRYKSGASNLTEFIGVEPSKKRKRRTSFTPQALELLNAHFDKNTHPTGNEITNLAQQLGYEREVIRIWFCNKRQALKNTVRMMSKTG